MAGQRDRIIPARHAQAAIARLARGQLYLASIIGRGKAIVSTALGMGEAAAKQTYQWIEPTTQGAGRAVTFIGNIPFLRNPFVRKIAGVLRLDWLVGMSDSPQPLDVLLEQLNRDFAIPLLALCRRIVQSSGEISAQEAKVIDAIRCQVRPRWRALKS